MRDVELDRVGIPSAVNSSGGKSTRSLHRGVRLEARDGKWQSRIKTRGKELYLGAFATEELAARAYDRAAICIHSRFNAITNFPISDYKEELSDLEGMKPEEIMSLLRREALLAGAGAIGNTETWSEGIKSSNFRGVRLEAGGSTWAARMQVNGRKIHLGSYSSEMAAARAYDRANICIHGFQSAVTNLERENYQSEAAYLEETPFETLVSMLREEGKIKPGQSLNVLGRLPGTDRGLKFSKGDPLMIRSPTGSGMQIPQAYVNGLQSDGTGMIALPTIHKPNLAVFPQIVPLNRMVSGQIVTQAPGVARPTFYGAPWQAQQIVFSAQGQPLMQSAQESPLLFGLQTATPVHAPPSAPTRVVTSPSHPTQQPPMTKTRGKRSLGLELFDGREKIPRQAQEKKKKKKAAEALLVLGHNQED